MSADLWDQILARVEGKVNRHSFATWFRTPSYVSLHSDRLRVAVPNTQFREWLSKNYQGVLAEALTEAAIREGLPHDAATKLVEQTLRGAGVLISESHKTPFALRAEVTSPGGTTAAAVHVLEEAGYRAAVEDAVRAAARRSRELGARARGGEDS